MLFLRVDLEFSKVLNKSNKIDVIAERRNER